MLELFKALCCPHMDDQKVLVHLVQFDNVPHCYLRWIRQFIQSDAIVVSQVFVCRSCLRPAFVNILLVLDLN